MGDGRGLVVGALLFAACGGRSDFSGRRDAGEAGRADFPGAEGGAGGRGAHGGAPLGRAGTAGTHPSPRAGSPAHTDGGASAQGASGEAGEFGSLGGSAGNAGVAGDDGNDSAGASGIGGEGGVAGGAGVGEAGADGAGASGAGGSGGSGGTGGSGGSTGGSGAITGGSGGIGGIPGGSAGSAGTSGASGCRVPITHARIQAAIEDAACSTVWVEAGRYGENLKIARDLKLVGNAPEVLVEPAADAPILTVTSGTVEILSMTFAHGKTSSGAAAGIVNHGALTLRNSLVSDNVALGVSVRGAGIHSTGPLVLDGTSVGMNVAEATGVADASAGPGAFGAGIYVEGAPLTLRNSASVSGNLARSNSLARGGGIYARDAQVILVTGSSVHDNRAEVAAGSAGESAEGGGLFLEKGSLWTEDFTLYQNLVLAGAGVASGGGLQASAVTSILLGAGTQIRENVATASSGTVLGGGAQVRAAAGAPITITGARFLGNRVSAHDGTASGGGLSIHAGERGAVGIGIDDSEFTENAVEGSLCEGAGVALAASAEGSEIAARFVGSTGARNASSGATVNGLFGAVAATAASSRVDLELVNSTLAGNQLDADATRSVVARGSALAALGANGGRAKLTLSSVTVVESEVWEDCPILWLDASTGSGLLTLRNTILATSSGKGVLGCSTSGGELESKGRNLYDPTKCTLMGNTAADVPLGDASFGGLSANGGPTPTVPLDSSSPAVDAGDPNGCRDAYGVLLTTDQRGVTRADRCDIGAYEYEKGAAP